MYYLFKRRILIYDDIPLDVDSFYIGLRATIYSIVYTMNDKCQDE